MNMFIKPDWPAPSPIHAFTTIRSGGISLPPYDQFNLGDHVGDDPGHVAKNRELLKKRLELSQEPVWIKQTHSNMAIKATSENRYKEADASFTDQINQACVVLTADCLPILLCHRLGTHIAAIHAGWRGLANGIIESTLSALQLSPDDLLAWLGPAISSQHFEVGNEVKECFIKNMPEAELAFTPSPEHRWLADLYLLARLRLQKQGITRIYGGNYCTYRNKELFYSYRRDGQTGRMASLIWIR